MLLTQVFLETICPTTFPFYPGVVFCFLFFVFFLMNEASNRRQNVRQCGQWLCPCSCFADRKAIKRLRKLANVKTLVVKQGGSGWLFCRVVAVVGFNHLKRIDDAITFDIWTKYSGDTPSIISTWWNMFPSSIINPIICLYSWLTKWIAVK